MRLGIKLSASIQGTLLSDAIREEFADFGKVLSPFFLVVGGVRVVVDVTQTADHSIVGAHGRQLILSGEEGRVSYSQILGLHFVVVQLVEEGVIVGDGSLCSRSS